VTWQRQRRETGPPLSADTGGEGRFSSRRCRASPECQRCLWVETKVSDRFEEEEGGKKRTETTNEEVCFVRQVAVFRRREENDHSIFEGDADELYR
jgi:hypothetical protein